VKEKLIRVEGYTETVLSASWSLQQYPTGWELAAARAVVVTRLLQNEGVSPLVLSAVSYGEYRPLSDNISELGRARNQRIQIVVIPKE
jgi:chemotaxis protein MotB